MFLASTPCKCMTRTVPTRKGRGEGGGTLEPRLLSFSSLPVWDLDIRKQPGQASTGSARKQKGPGRSAHRRGGGGSVLAGSGDDAVGVMGKSQDELQRLGQPSAGHLIRISWGSPIGHLIRTSWGGGIPDQNLSSVNILVVPDSPQAPKYKLRQQSEKTT